MKGVAEQELQNMHFDRLSLFKPYIISQPGHSTPLEAALHFAYPTLGWLLPPNYHPTSVNTLSKAMRFNAEIGAVATVERFQHQVFNNAV